MTHDATSRLSAGALAGYGALGLPLAFAALPVYIYAPKFYAGLGLSLTTAGAILLAARWADAIIDPFLGAASDRATSPKIFVAIALVPLALGMLALFNPPAGVPLGAWMCAALAVVTAGFSAASIAYQAWGARLGAASERTAVAAAREGFGLAGVIIASLLPQAFAPTVEQGLAATALTFVAIVLVSATVTLSMTPTPRAPSRSAVLRRGLTVVLASARMRALLAVFALNGIASAIPATLFLFFVADVLELADRSGQFLALYFIAAALGLPLWVRMARHVGKPRAWLAAMGLAIVAFAWAFLLGPGDALAFAVISGASGMALGADLALPPAMLADTIERDGAAGSEGAYFGVWNFVTKLNLALAAGVALPALEAFGYRPGLASAGPALAVVYCLVPCVLKLIAAATLARTSPILQPLANP